MKCLWMILLVASPLCLACAGKPPAETAATSALVALGPAELEPGEDADQTAPRAVADALEQAVEHGWRKLHLTVQCPLDDGPKRLEIFGSGAGIWDGKKQFTLSAGEVRQQLEILTEADFAGMAERYDVERKEDPEWLKSWPGATSPDGSRQRMALQVRCRITLELDGVVHQVVQTDRNNPSQEIQQLAARLYAVSAVPSKQGVGVDDVDDGLRKIARGELAVETLSLIAHRKPRRAEDGPGYLLRLTGGEASNRVFRPEEGYGETLALDLTADDLAPVLRQLAEQRVGELPINLYAEHYTSLSIEILNRRRQIQARRFDGMTWATHGERQTRFERVLDALDVLAQRVVEDGEPVAK